MCRTFQEFLQGYKLTRLPTPQNCSKTAHKRLTRPWTDWIDCKASPIISCRLWPLRNDTVGIYIYTYIYIIWPEKHKATGTTRGSTDQPSSQPVHPILFVGSTRFVDRLRMSRDPHVKIGPIQDPSTEVFWLGKNPSGTIGGAEGTRSPSTRSSAVRPGGPRRL